ncbi:MAG: DEAD/DEAH box helicase [Pseudomonadota bacterium]
MTTFSEMDLAGPILKALEREGYTKPTPIQTQAIPPAIAGRDILGIAQTGTGKTAAFALPILHRLMNDRKPLPRKGARVLVLSPTRELASQIAASFTAYAVNMPVKIATVFGGVGHGPQIKKLSRGVDVLVATPGRLLDHLTTGAIKLDQTEVLVLDEADQMLDLGFVKPIRSIVSRLPRNRQTLFFSATMPASISELARAFLRNPERVSVAPVSSTAERVSQRVIHLSADRKRAAMVKLIVEQQMERTLVFTRTKRGADRVARHLAGAGIETAAIHGNKSQNQRERALEAFRSAKIQVLVATDIAARGIDIEGVSHVINYELPEVPEAYVHRIGRTARAGASGSAISLCDHSELKYLRGIERLIRQKVPSDTYDPGSGENALSADEADNNRQSHKGKRGANSQRRPSNQRANNRGRNGNPATKTASGRQTAKPKANSRKRNGGARRQRAAAV